MISYNYLLCAGGLPVEALVAAADPPTARNKAISAAMKPFLRDRNWLIGDSSKQYLEGGLLSWDFISEHWPESETRLLSTGTCELKPTNCRRTLPFIHQYCSMIDTLRTFDAG